LFYIAHIFLRLLLALIANLAIFGHYLLDKSGRIHLIARILGKIKKSYHSLIGDIVSEYHHSISHLGIFVNDNSRDTSYLFSIYLRRNQDLRQHRKYFFAQKNRARRIVPCF